MGQARIPHSAPQSSSHLGSSPVEGKERFATVKDRRSTSATFRRRLNWQLSIGFSVLVFAFCIVFTSLTLLFLRLLIDRSLEIQNWSLASDLAEELQPSTQGSIDFLAVHQKMDLFRKFSPDVRVFFLDSKGQENYLFSPDTVPSNNRPRFDLNTIEAALQDQDAQPQLYTLSWEKHHKIPFSVARLQMANEPGYLLILLRFSDFNPISGLIFENAALPLVILTILGLVLASIGISWALFRMLTKNFYALLETVRAYRDGDFTKRVSIDSRNEMGELSASVNEMADQIVNQINELKHKDEVRKALIANVAHDLRSPATGILALADTLQISRNRLKEEEFQSCLDGIVESGESLERMIAELFELARLESGELKAELRDQGVDDILSSASSRFHALAKRRGVHFEYSLTNTPTTILCDPFLLGRVIDNLLGNALKFTAEGGTVGLFADIGESHVLLSISDTGSGIPAEELEKIFERFHQVQESDITNDRKSLGLGLGLAIVSEILSLHQSQIQVESELGRGSRFSFPIKRLS